MLTVSAVAKHFDLVGGRRVEALSEVSLDIRDGEFVSLIGPSGCGKSTLLSIMGGLLPANTGTITVDGAVITRPDPARIAYVFQSYDLFPWRTVTNNVAYGLELRGVPKAERMETAQWALDIVGLKDFSEVYPGQLSGGMQQRVAIARALALGARILLLDEPFGALDEQTRLMLADEILSLWAKTKKTVVLVTHSLQEAVYLSDRIFIFSRRPGRIKRVVEPGLPRPRHPSMFNAPEFLAARTALWEELSVEWAT